MFDDKKSKYVIPPKSTRTHIFKFSCFLSEVGKVKLLNKINKDRPVLFIVIHKKLKIKKKDRPIKRLCGLYQFLIPYGGDDIPVRLSL